MPVNKETRRNGPMHFSRGREALLSQYAEAAVCLYGVISIDEFVEVFNYYEIDITTAEEVLLALNSLAQTEEVEYSISGSILSGPDFQPQFDDYKENVDSLRASRNGKLRYLPDKTEFLRYLDFLYREPEKPYADLKAYILKNNLITSDDWIDDVDGDLIDLHDMIQFGVKAKEELEYFVERGYQFKDLETLNEFNQLVVNVHNNTRMYDNNGFTPNEISAQSKPSELQPLPKMNRNELCFCGSGLKYKNCHGKLD